MVYELLLRHGRTLMPTAAHLHQLQENRTDYMVHCDSTHDDSKQADTPHLAVKVIEAAVLATQAATSRKHCCIRHQQSHTARATEAMSSCVEMAQLSAWRAPATTTSDT